MLAAARDKAKGPTPTRFGAVVYIIQAEAHLRRAVSSTCVTLLAPPDPAGGGLGRSRLVS